ELRRHRDTFAAENDFEDEVPEEIPAVYCFGDPEARLRVQDWKERMSPASRRSARSESPKSTRQSSRGSPMPPEAFGRSPSIRPRSAEQFVDLNPDEIYERAKEKLKRVMFHDSPTGASPSSKTGQLKVAGLYPGKRCPDEDIDASMRRWVSRKTSKGESSNNKRKRKLDST
ncbi:unnamed protein product, partial [Amoebophrya sp. A25]